MADGKLETGADPAGEFDTAAFERIAAQVDTPMYLVTAQVDGERSGCLVGFGTQCSIDPRHFLVCISKENHTFGIAARAPALVIHVLREGDHELARLFGEETGDEVDKFAGCRWRDGPGGTVVVDGVDWFSGPVVATVDAGDHQGFVVALEDVAAARHGEPFLTFQDVKDLDPGHPVETSTADSR